MNRMFCYHVTREMREAALPCAVTVYQGKLSLGKAWDEAMLPFREAHWWANGSGPGREIDHTAYFVHNDKYRTRQAYWVGPESLDRGYTWDPEALELYRASIKLEHIMPGIQKWMYRGTLVETRSLLDGDFSSRFVDHIMTDQEIFDETWRGENMETEYTRSSYEDLLAAGGDENLIRQVYRKHEALYENQVGYYAEHGRPPTRGERLERWIDRIKGSAIGRFRD